MNQRTELIHLVGFHRLRTDWGKAQHVGPILLESCARRAPGEGLRDQSAASQSPSSAGGRLL
jgi:hypothetical protein